MSRATPGVGATMRPLARVAANLWKRVHSEGAETVPADGAQMICFNHGHYADVTMVTSQLNKDTRLMMAQEQFVGPFGKVAHAMGFIPVDRNSKSPRPVNEFIRLMDNGISTAIAPEGRIWDDQEIHEFKGGAAMAAMRSKCESVIPVVIHYEDHKLTAGDKGRSLLLGAAVAGTALAASMLGGPGAQLAASLLTGAGSGALLGGLAAFRGKRDADLKDQLTGVAKGALGGALLGAAAGGLGEHALGAQAAYLAAPLSMGLGAAAGLGALAFASRGHAYIKVCPPMDVAPYRAMPDERTARFQLSDDVRSTMIATKHMLKQQHAEAYPSRRL